MADKCKKCNGTGVSHYILGEPCSCNYCNGTGKAPMAKKCINCVFYEASTKESNIGECRHNSPVINQITGIGNWPKVYEAYWCGNFVMAWRD